MSYYERGHVAADDDVDDFDEYDPTPYGGGYDQAHTYGRSLPASDEICYQPSSSDGGGYDYDRPQYSSYAQQSDYGNVGGYVVSHQHHGYGGSESGGYGGYGVESEGYGGNFEHESHQSQEYGGFESGYGGRFEQERPSYGRRNEEEGEDYNDRRRYAGGGDDDDDNRLRYGGYRDDDDADRRRYGGDEDYGRQKYGGDESDEDDEGRRNRRQYYDE